MGKKNFQAGQLIPTSSTPPGNAGFYRIDKNTIGVVGSLVQKNANTNAESNVATGANLAAELAFVRPFEMIKDRISYGVDAGEEIKYIVSGDSTRDMTFHSMLSYYEHHLNKLGVTVVDNSRASQTGKGWADGTTYPSESSLALAITASGDGTNVILEYSFGVNDWDIGTETQVASWLKNGILAYKAACPNALVVLVTPLTTTNTARTTGLRTIYQNMAAELSLPLIDIVAMTGAVLTDYSFYYDTTHPTKYGAARIVNFILDRVLSADAKKLTPLSDSYFASPAVPSAGNIAGTFEQGYWGTSDGQPQASTTWRRLLEIAVTPLFCLRMKTFGNKNDMLFVNNSNVLVRGNIPLTPDGDGWVKITVPEGATKLRANLSTGGTVYDALVPVPEVRYETPLTMTQVNAGTVSRMLGVA